MGTRIKTYDSTGNAPNGRIYAGDLNAIQDQYADLTNLSQTHSVGVLAIGESGLQLLRYGAGEARISGALRLDTILRALGGLYAGAFTTTQRDAIASGSRPYGLVILNTTTNQYEWNKGTDASPDWQPLGSPPLTFVTLTTNYTLVLADKDRVVEINSGSAATVTVPANSSVAFPVGTAITVAQYGAGQVTIAAAGGVTLRGNPGLKTASQYALATLIKRATDEWYVGGNLVP